MPTCQTPNVNPIACHYHARGPVREARKGRRLEASADRHNAQPEAPSIRAGYVAPKVIVLVGGGVGVSTNVSTMFAMQEQSA
jgi:hypothetical protein